MLKCIYDNESLIRFHEFKDRDKVKYRLYVCRKCGALWEHNLDTNHIKRKTSIYA